MKIGFVLPSVNIVRVPPMGLLLLADLVRRNIPNTEIKIIDNTFENIYEETLKFKPDMLCISILTEDYKKSIEYATKIKQHFNIPIIIGSVHISMLPSSFHKIFDIGVIGEGWITLLELINLYKKENNFNPEKLEKIKGIVFFNKNKLTITEPRPQLKSLDDIPIIDYDLINPQYFKKRPILETLSYGISIAILTSIGCPYNCKFCSTKAFWKTVRYFPIKHVVEEIKTLVTKYNVTHIDIIDDLFFINKKRMQEIYEALKKENLIGKFTLGCQGRVDLIDDETCELLKKMNCKVIAFGFESGSDKVLKYLKNDTVTVENNKKAILICKKHGIAVYGNLIIGAPNETLEDMNKTLEFIDFAKKAGADRVYASILVPYPGTEMWEIAKQRGQVNDSEMDWSKLTYYEKNNPHLINETISLQQFQKKYREIKRKTNIFTYKAILKTLLNSPLTYLKTFIHDYKYHLRRLNYTFREQY